MIKNLKVVNIKTTPFEGRKSWALSNVSNDDVILTEGGNQLLLEYVDYGNGGSLPILNSSCLISLDQQTADEVTLREGQYTTGIFYSDSDPQNTDGTYKRVIYSQVKTMFYNNYRDPSKMWGLEVLDFEKAGTLKFLTENLRLFSIPQYVFGDKMSEKSVVIYDNSLDNEYLITDDGKENLFAGPNLFSKVQEIGDFENLFLSGRQSGCEYYFDAINTASAPILTASAITNTTAVLSWIDNSTNEDGFVIELSTNSGSTYSIFLYEPANETTASDTTLSSGVTHWYRMYAYNSFGNSNYSNTSSATGIIYYAPTIITQPQSITSSVGSNVTFSVTVSGTAPFAYQWKTGSTDIVNGVYITGSATDILYLNSITTASEGYHYRVFISNSIGGVTSSYAGLLVPVADDTLYDMTGSAYILGPYDTFESYDTGSIPTNGGFGWASAWDIRTISAPAIQKVIVEDDFSQYSSLSGSYVSSTNWTGGWGWGTGSITTAYPMTGNLGTLSNSRFTRSIDTIFTGSVTLNWTSWPINVNEVRVLRSISNSSSFVQVNTILSQSLSVTDVNSLVNGETYYYKLEQWNILSSSFTNVISLSYNVSTESFSTYTLDQTGSFNGGIGWEITWSVKTSGST